jgi:pilus assembly protein CpaC
MRILSLRLGAALLAGLLSPVPAPPAAAATVVAPGGQTIELEVGKGSLVRLDRPAASVFVAEPEIADIQVKSPNLVYVLGKAAGETSLYAVGEGDEILLSATVSVHHNLARLQQALRKLAPRSDIHVASVDDSLVLEGVVGSAAEAEDVRRIAARFVPDSSQLVNKLRVDAPTQVNIRVRVAEMSREVIKQLGFNWESVVAPGSFLFGLATGQPVFSNNVALPGGGPRQFNTRQFSGSAQQTVNSVTGSYVSRRVDLNALIDALDHEGLVSILAEPNLTASSGELASFLAGGEFPVPVPQDRSTVTIDFKKFGVGLDFVANIGADGRISLRVRPEVSQLSTAGQLVVNGVSVPALTTRRAETTVELGSGQSFAIAGLLQNSVTQDLEKFPGLGDLPVLGALFRSSRFQRSETELVIIVTPYLVRPVSGRAMLAATDGFVAPDDRERYLQGGIYRPQPATPPAGPVGRNGTGLVGPFGFDLE